MKSLFGAVLALIGFAASAAYSCIPREHGGTGEYTSVAENANGSSLAWYCANSPDPKMAMWTRTVLKNYVPSASCAAAIAPIVVANAASSVAARSLLPIINAAAAACDSVPAVGTVERQQYDELESLALMMTRSKYAAANPTTGPVWRTTGGTIYSFVNNKLTPIFSRKAPVGALATPPKASIGTTTLCALDGGVLTEVTACTQR